MKLKFNFIAAGAAILCFTGCLSWTVEDSAARYANRDAEKSGSPYRFRVNRVSGGKALEKYRSVPPSAVVAPANLRRTTADAKLQNDVLIKIAQAQSDWGDTTTPVLLGVQPLTESDGSVKETWFIKHKDGAIRYEVSLSQRPDGVAFAITIP
jgi:hypothetical protein